LNLFVAMLGVGLASSVHCVAMCGSMVLTYAVKGDAEGPWLKRMLPHFAYHSAKLTSYVITGMILGAIGAVLNLTGIRGWVTVAAGLFMVFLGLQLTGKFPALARFALRPPKFVFNMLSKTRKRAKADAAQGHASLATPITFGLMTGLMPCGPLQGAQIASAAAGSAAAGGLAMLGFGLGTMPLMLGFGAVSGMLGPKFRERMMVVAAVIVMGLGLVMVDRGATLLGSPVTSQSIKQAVLGAPAATSTQASYKTGADGVVEVPLVIENTQYVPSTLDLPADKPVRLVVDRREDNACSDQLAVPQLGVLVNLKANGVTNVDLPATKAGSYNLTCGMAMMSGTLRVGTGATAAGGASPLIIGLLAMLGIAVGWTVYARNRRKAAEKPQAPVGNRSSGAGKKSGIGETAPERPAKPAPATVLGFSPAEALGILVVVVAAVILGLGVGGYFN
jgi:uncharacterized protein